MFSIATTTHEINEQIRDPEVRLISADGEQLGIVAAEEALRIATESGYELVKIAPNSIAVLGITENSVLNRKKKKKRQKRISA